MMPSKYKPEYCELLIKHMSAGLSFETFGCTLNVARSTTYEWMKEFPEFKEAHLIAQNKAMLFFEQRLVAKASGSKINNKNFDVKLISENSLFFALKTRFYKTYGDRQKIEQETSVTLKEPVQIKITTSTETRALEDIENE